MPSISTSLFAGQQRADTVALRVLKTIDLVIWHRNRHRISRKNVVERSSPNLGHLSPPGHLHPTKITHHCGHLSPYLILTIP